MSLAIASGFEDEPIEASASFRILLDAMARPGTIHNLPVELDSMANLNKGAMLSLLTLADHETPVWLDEHVNTELARYFLRFHCSAKLTEDKSQAMFAVFSSTVDINLLDEFPIGTSDYPDASTTLIIQVDNIYNGRGLILSGPGIKSTNHLRVDGLDDSIWLWLKRNNARFPLGLDVILATDETVAALPRSVQIMEFV